MFNVFEIKPGYAVRLTDGTIMFAVATSNMDGVEDTGFGLMDVKVRKDAKPMTVLFGHDECGDSLFWPIGDCYNEKFEYKDDRYGRDCDRDIDIVYGYGTPRTVFSTSDKAISIRPVLWKRDAEIKCANSDNKSDTTGDDKKPVTYEDAKKAIEDWRDEINASDLSDSEKMDHHTFVNFLEMLTDIAHLCEDDGSAADDDDDIDF